MGHSRVRDQVAPPPPHTPPTHPPPPLPPRLWGGGVVGGGGVVVAGGLWGHGGDEVTNGRSEEMKIFKELGCL